MSSDPAERHACLAILSWRKTLCSTTFVTMMSLCQTTWAQQLSVIEAEIREAQRELSEQQPQSAYERLMSLEQEAAGDVGFDYWLGVAAVRAGDLEQAITALERVVMVQPLHAGARLELAGVFILQSRWLEAASQLDAIEQLNPPESARLAIAQYRSLIERAEQGRTGTSLTLLALDLGHDSNYLNYPDSFDLFANTALQGFAILSKQATSFYQTRALHFRSFDGLREGQTAEWSIAAQSRNNEATDARIFNTLSLQSSLTLVSPVTERTEWRLTATGSQLWLDNTAYRTGVSAAAEIRHSLSERTNISIRIRGRESRFKDPGNNHLAWLGEAVMNYRFSSAARLRITVNQEWENLGSRALRQGGDSKRSTLDVNLNWGADGAQHQFSTGAIYQQLDYARAGFAIFNSGVSEKRSDTSSTVHIEWTFQPTSRWRVSTRAQLRNQSSNINFFAMDQTIIQTSINYIF